MRGLRFAWLVAGASLVFAAACDDDDNGDQVAMEVALAGENEVPPVATTATGEVTAIRIGDTLDVEGEFSDLESDLIEVGGTSAHVHEGDVDVAGPVVFDLDVESDDGRSGTFDGTFELNDEQEDLFERGLLYVNVHTEQNPGGELRGQLMEDAPEPSDLEAAFDARLSADSEVEDVESDATGTGIAILRDGMMTVSGTFEGLTSPLRDIEDVGPAHIHEAPEGQDGPVIFPLEVLPEEDMRSGRFSLMQELSEEEEDALRRGDYYINIHTEEFPGGEIRGQLLQRE